MTVNRRLLHVFVLPEDGANRQVANGFYLQLDFAGQKQMYVLQPAGGWGKVLDLFESEHAPQMDRFPKRMMVLLIDFDQRQDRLDAARARIRGDLADRVFVLGAWTRPEDLKADLGSYETIGSGMAADCRDGTNRAWGHALLRHNADEIERLRLSVRPILFGAN